MLKSLKENGVPGELIADVEKIFEEMKKRSDNYLRQLLDARHELIEQDYILQNQKTYIEQTKKTIESLEKKNESMKTLLLEEWK